MLASSRRASRHAVEPRPRADAQPNPTATPPCTMQALGSSLNRGAAGPLQAETAETMRLTAAAGTVKATAPMPDQPSAGDALLRMPSEHSSTLACALANEQGRPKSRPLDAGLATRRDSAPRLTQSMGAGEPERPASPFEHANPVRVAGLRGESCASLCFGRVAQFRTGWAAKCREGLRAGHRRPPSSKPTRTGSRLLGLLVSLPVVVAPTSFSDKSSLQGALAEWCGNPTSAEAAHGHISAWDTGEVTDMSGQSWSTSFFGSTCSSFNGPIGSWNVAKVTNMEFMFYVSPGPLPHRATAHEPPALPAAAASASTRASASLASPPPRPAVRRQLQPAPGLERRASHELFWHVEHVRCKPGPLPHRATAREPPALPAAAASASTRASSSLITSPSDREKTPSPTATSA